MRVAIPQHVANSVPYTRALTAAGVELVGDHAGADAFLIDLDFPFNAPLIEHFSQQGARILVYPHGVGVNHYYDGIEDPHPLTDGMLVIGEGFAEAYRRMGYPKPLHVIGWTLCEQRPFRPCDAPRRVLFAPDHPLENGHLSDWQQALNRETFEALGAVPGIELTVRHLQELERSGLTREPGVTYVQGRPDNSYADIDAADVVVARTTYAHIAVARGAPTIMFGQHVRPSNGEHPGERRYAASWEAWRDLVRYPFDMRDGAAGDLIAAAAAGEAPIADWKRRFIGEPLDPRAFARTLEDAVAAARLPDLRRFVTLADARAVAAAPELLAAYASQTGPEDDATLVLTAPGENAEELVTELQRVIAHVGLTEEAVPDLLLWTDPLPPATARALAARASARLSG